MALSSDDLTRLISTTAQAVDRLQGAAPLWCSFAIEELAHQPRADWQDVRAFQLAMLQCDSPLDEQNPPFLNHDRRHRIIVAPAAGISPSDAATAYRQYADVATKMVNIVKGLADPVLDRLGISNLVQWTSRWERILFPLAWNFRRRFEAADRFRWSRRSGPTWDEWLHLHVDSARLDEPFPGVVFSSIHNGIHLAEATAIALSLISDATRPSAPLVDFRPELVRLRADFETSGERASRMGSRDADMGLAAWFVRSGPSLALPAASIWAGLPQPGPFGHRHYLVSRLGDEAEYCVVRGLASDEFHQLADKAGSLFAEWPDRQYPGLLHQTRRWDQSVAERVRVAGGFQTFLANARGDDLVGGCPDWLFFEVGTGNGSDRMVTDQRGNVERWLGILFTAIKLRRPELLQVKTFPKQEQESLGPWNSVVTLKDTNLLEASVQVIDWLLDGPAHEKKPRRGAPGEKNGTHTPAKKGGAENKPGRPESKRTPAVDRMIDLWRSRDSVVPPIRGYADLKKALLVEGYKKISIATIRKVLKRPSVKKRLQSSQ